MANLLKISVNGNWIALITNCHTIITCIESALMISPLNRRASSMASLDLPVAVEPMTTSSGSCIAASLITLGSGLDLGVSMLDCPSFKSTIVYKLSTTLRSSQCDPQH